MLTTGNWKGKPEWFDLLINYAESDATAASKHLINDLRLEFQYSSGTVVGLCGMILGQWELGLSCPFHKGGGEESFGCKGSRLGISKHVFI